VECVLLLSFFFVSWSRNLLICNCGFLCVVSRHRTLMNVFDKAPIVDKEAFVAPSASVIGDVHIGRGSSIWYGCVLRGELATKPQCLVFGG